MTVAHSTRSACRTNGGNLGAAPVHGPAHPGHTAKSTRLTRHAGQCAPSRLASLLIVQLLVLAWPLKLPPWRRPGDPLVLVEHSQARLKPVRPAKPLKLWRDLRVIQVTMIAAAGADQLIQVGVAALDLAVDDADRLAAQDDPAAVAGLTGGRGCRNLVRHDAEQRVTVLTGTRYGDNGRSAVRRIVRGARTAHSTHRQEVDPVTTGVWSSDAVTTRRYMQAAQKDIFKRAHNSCVGDILIMLKCECPPPNPP